mmetsp:Transcript_47666/g.85157  ORF Transcript_47666/g.85157 Transcript_47666/m.85157 type:complete len:108 (-) Transcript_47666:519-842(-)
MLRCSGSFEAQPIDTPVSVHQTWLHPVTLPGPTLQLVCSISIVLLARPIAPHSPSLVCRSISPTWQYCSNQLHMPANRQAIWRNLFFINSTPSDRHLYQSSGILTGH